MPRRKKRELLVIPLEGFQFALVGVEAEDGVEITFQERIQRRIKRSGGCLTEDQAKRLSRWLAGDNPDERLVAASRDDEPSGELLIHRVTRREQTRIERIKLPEGVRPIGVDEGALFEDE